MDLTSAQWIYFYYNNIERIDGQLFRNNLRVNTIYLTGNRINSIHPDFIQGLNNLNNLHLEENICVDQWFTRSGSALQPSIPETLQGCFSNFAPGRVRRFHMALEGDLTLTEL